MKALITTFALALSSIVYSQNDGINFINDKIGERVGKGVCAELVVEYLNHIGYSYKYLPSKEDMEKNLVYEIKGTYWDSLNPVNELGYTIDSTGNAIDARTYEAPQIINSINGAQIQVGDIMHFSNVSIDPYTNSPYNGGKRNTQVGAHIGIVYGVNDDGTILIAEQNIGSFGKKYKTIKYNNYSIEVFYDSHVQIDLLDILCVSYGTIKIYRY